MEDIKPIVDSSGKRETNNSWERTFAYVYRFMFVISCCTKQRRKLISCALIVKTLYYEDKHKSTDCTLFAFTQRLHHRFPVSNEEPF